MNFLWRFTLALLSWPLRLGRRHQPRRQPDAPRILVIRRSRLGDMVCALPLLHTLRQRYPQARITVACDLPGFAVAQACPAVDEVVLLESAWNQYVAIFKNAARLQSHDWVIAVKGGFDRRLALLTRMTNGARRIGFCSGRENEARYFTDPVPLPADIHTEHQIDTVLRLLTPLGGADAPPIFQPEMLRLKLPSTSLDLAQRVLGSSPFAGAPGFALVNLSSNRSMKFSAENYAEIIRWILESTHLTIGITSAPDDFPAARALAEQFPAGRVTAVATPSPLDLAALLAHATFFLTAEGGGSHLAAAMNTPALVLWWEGPFQKWCSRSPKHLFVHLQPGETAIPPKRVCQALQRLLSFKEAVLKKE